MRDGRLLAASLDMYPVLFSIPKIGSFGPFPVHSFGVMMVIAFAAALWLLKARAPRFGIDPSKMLDAGFWALIAGVLGARIAFILQDLPYFLSHTDELFSLQFAGLTSFGGLIAAIGVLAFWAKKEKIPAQTIFDICAPAFLLGHIIGRIGCLLNGCCYGGVCSTNFILATHFVGLDQPHHPAQIYDAFMNLIALGALFFLERRGLKMGQAAAFGLIGYNASRFIYEFWRAGTPAEVAQGLASSTTIGSSPITEAHLMSGAMIIVGTVWFYLARRNRPEFSASRSDIALEKDAELSPA